MKRFLFILIACVLMSGVCFAEPMFVTASITAQNTWTAGLNPYTDTEANYLNVSISGTGWTATVTLQRSYPEAPTTWYDVETWTANAEEQLWDDGAGVKYRIGVATGDYAAGTVVVRLSK